jgi:hypothetical protein
MRPPHPPRIGNVSAIGFARQQRFFNGKAGRKQQARQRGGMRLHPAFRQKPCRKLWHGDVAFGLNPADRSIDMTPKPPAASRPAPTRRRQGARSGLALRKTNRRARRNPKSPRRRTAGLAALNLSNNPNPKVRRTALAHDPPPITVTHKSTKMGIPRFIFSVRRSSRSYVNGSDGASSARKIVIMVSP